jgi:hypothetical protein
MGRLLERTQREHVSQIDPRVVLMLRELQAIGPKLGHAPVPMPLPEPADIRLEPTPHGAWLYLFAEGVARVVHFRKTDAGYLWNGELWLEGAFTADDLYRNETARRTMAKWNEPPHPPTKTYPSRNQSVNAVRTVSTTLSSTNALRAFQRTPQK